MSSYLLQFLFMFAIVVVVFNHFDTLLNSINLLNAF